MKKSLMFIAAILIFSLLFTAPGCTSGASNPGNQNQNQQGNIVGSWATGDSIITFNPDGTYIQTVQGITFDTGTYTASGGQCTMASRGGHTSTGSYRVSGNTLTGFTDSSGRLTTYSRTSSPPGNVGYEYWKGDIPNACYILNCDGERALKLTGKPFMVLTYNKITHEIIDFEFGLSEVIQQGLSTKNKSPVFPEPTLYAENFFYQEKLDLKSPVISLVGWDSSFPGYTSKKSITIGVQNFSTRSDKEEWKFNYTSSLMEGDVKNLDNNLYAGRESESKAFKLMKK